MAAGATEPRHLQAETQESRCCDQPRFKARGRGGVGTAPAGGQGHRRRGQEHTSQPSREAASPACCPLVCSVLHEHTQKQCTPAAWARLSPAPPTHNISHHTHATGASEGREERQGGSGMFKDMQPENCSKTYQPSVHGFKNSVPLREKNTKNTTTRHVQGKLMKTKTKKKVLQVQGKPPAKSSNSKNRIEG